MAKNDKTAPKLISVYPNKGSSAVALDQKLILTFNKAIQVGSGNIIISSGNETKKIALTSSSSSQFSVAENSLTLNLADYLRPNSLYTIKIEKTAIEDLSGNKYSGITNATTCYFSTVDTLPPTVSKCNNSPNFSIKSNLILTFNEKIKKGEGNITLVSNHDSRIISINDDQVNISANTLTINPTMDLYANTTYKLSIDAGAIKDLAPAANSNNLAEYIFTTKATSDKQAPLLQSRLLTGTSKDSLILTFQEEIKVGKGSFTLNNGSTSISIPVNDPQVSIVKNILTIHPTIEFEPQKIYTLTAPKGIVSDLANNAFAGLTKNAPFIFDTTDKIPPTLTITNDKNTTTRSEVIYTFTSSEPINFSDLDISVKGGTKGDFKSVAGKNSFTLSVIPDANSVDAITVEVAQGAFTDLAGNKNTTAEKKTQPVDTMCPVLQESSPNNGSSYFSHTGNIVLIFNEDIFAGTGNFVISNGSDSQTISVNDEKQVVINGRVVTINPTNDLLENSHYNMTFLPNVLTDKVGNNFAGLTLPTQLNFYTHSISSTLKDTFSTGKNLTEKLNAKALDGYLKNATVFADANGDGIQNADEATTTTDENGNFELINAKGTLVVSGGIDLSTGNAFEGTLKAPEGSVVVTPLTTVLQGFIDEKQTPAEAKKSVAKAFGFDSTVDLTSYDPISEMINSTQTPSTQSAATQIMASSAQIVNFLVTAGRVLQGAAGDNGNLSTKDANDALLKSLVTSIKEGNGAISMNDSALLKTVLVNGAKEANAQAQAGGLPPKFDATNFTDKIGKMADTVTAVLKEAADNIINAVNKSNTEQPLTLLKNMDKISTFAQNDAGKSLQQAAIELDIKDDAALQKSLQNQVKLLTGLPAKQAIENNNVQTEKAVPTILAAGTQNPVQPNPNNPNTNSPNTPPGTNNSTAPNTNDSGTPPSTTTPPNSNNPNTNSPNTPPGTNNSTAPNTNDSGTPPSTTTPPNSNNPNTSSPNTPPGTNNSTAPNANDSGTPPSTATPPNSNNSNTNSPNTPPSTNNPIAPTNDSGALSDTQLPHDAPPLIGVVGTSDHL